jgi:hypothetical protein
MMTVHSLTFHLALVPVPRVVCGRQARVVMLTGVRKWAVHGCSMQLRAYSTTDKDS